MTDARQPAHPAPPTDLPARAGRGARASRGRGPRIRGWRGLLGTYVAGSTPVHRSPVALKLAVLLAATVTLTLVRSLGLSVGAVLAGAALAWWVGIPPRRLARMLLVPALALLPVAAFGWWQHGLARGSELALDVLAAIVLATVVTASTRADRLVDSLVRGSRWLRPLGFSPERFALAISLMLRAIPALLETMGDVRDAAVARGLGRSPRAYLVPFAVRAVGRAHATGEALSARGLADQESDPGSAPVGERRRGR